MTSTPTYLVHPERGFLPADDPLTALPDRFAVSDEIAADLPKLVPQERVRDAV